GPAVGGRGEHDGRGARGRARATGGRPPVITSAQPSWPSWRRHPHARGVPAARCASYRGAVGQSAIVGRARQVLGRLSMTAAPWTLVAEELVAQLRQVVGFDSFCVVQNDPRARLPAAAVSGDHCLSLRQGLVGRRGMRGRDVNKAGVRARAARPVGGLSNGPGGDLARSARWRELLAPAGIGDELRAALVADGRWWGSVSLYRERRSPRFTAEDAEAVGGLIGPSAAVARTAWTAGPDRAGVVPDAPGTLLVTADGQTVTATPSGYRWLARLPSTQRASGSLVQALTAHLAAAADRNLAPRAVTRLRAGLPGTACSLVPSAPQRLAERPAEHLADGGQRDGVDHLHPLWDLLPRPAPASPPPQLVLASTGAGAHSDD